MAETFEFPYYSGTRKMTLKEAGEHYGIHPGTLYKRYMRGWTPAQMIQKPRKTKPRKKTVFNFGNGQLLTRKTAAKRFGIPYDVLCQRLNRGWDPKKAARTPVASKTYKSKADKDRIFGSSNAKP